MKLYLCSNLHFLIINKADHFYLYIIHLGECLVHTVCPFVYWVICVLLTHSLYALYSNTLICWKYLLACGFSFNNIYGLIFQPKVLNFKIFKFVNLLIFDVLLFVSYLKNSSHTWSNKDFPLYFLLNILKFCFFTFRNYLE